jgi:hypothetical protein
LLKLEPPSSASAWHDKRPSAALEGAQAALKQRDEEVSRLNGEMTQLSVSLADQHQAVEE